MKSTITLTRDALTKKLGVLFPKMNTRPSEAFDGHPGGIWITSESTPASNGDPLFAFYAEDPTEQVYVFGVHREIREVLDASGWFAEPYDAGTWFLWAI
jgi:hypothetical protein